MSNAKSMIETVSNIFNAADAKLAGMANKDRIQLKEMAQSIANDLRLDPKDVLGFVTYFARNTDAGYVSRGKNGGLIKGSRPAKNAAKPAASVDSSDDDSSDDDSSDDE